MIFKLIFLIVLIFLGIRSKYLFRNNLELNKLTSYGFLFKAISILILILVFENLGNDSNLFVDSIGYMRDTAILHDVFQISPITYFKFLTGIGETNELVLKYLSNTNLWDTGTGLYNDSKNVVRVNSIIYFISNGNPYIHVIFMCLFSTIGLRLIVSAFKKYVEAYKTLFFILLFLLPSVFIATGGVLKEPFLILGIGLFLNGLLSENYSKWKWLTLMFGLILLICFKPYVLLLLLLAISFFLFSKYTFAQKPSLSLSLFTTTLILLFFIIQPVKSKTVEYISKKQLDMERIASGGLYVFENNETPRVLYFKLEEIDKLEIKNDSIQIVSPIKVSVSQHDMWEDFKVITMNPTSEKWKIYAFFPSRANTFFHSTPIRNSTSTFIKSIPEAFINGMFRPFPNDAKTAFKFPAMLEVLFCVGILFVSFFYRKKLSNFEKKLIASILIFFVTSLILVGFTTPVVGALVRYRIPSYIALIVLSFIIFKIPEKWKNRIQ